MAQQPHIGRTSSVSPKAMRSGQALSLVKERRSEKGTAKKAAARELTNEQINNEKAKIDLHTQLFLINKEIEFRETGVEEDDFTSKEWLFLQSLRSLTSSELLRMKTQLGQELEKQL